MRIVHDLPFGFPPPQVRVGGMVGEPPHNEGDKEPLPTDFSATLVVSVLEDSRIGRLGEHIEIQGSATVLRYVLTEALRQLEEKAASARQARALAPEWMTYPLPSPFRREVDPTPKKTDWSAISVGVRLL